MPALHATAADMKVKLWRFLNKSGNQFCCFIFSVDEKMLIH